MLSPLQKTVSPILPNIHNYKNQLFITPQTTKEKHSKQASNYEGDNHNYNTISPENEEIEMSIKLKPLMYKRSLRQEGENG